MLPYLYRTAPVALVLCCVLWSGPAAAGDTFTNEDVLTLAKLGLDDDVIIGKIKQAPEVEFQLETDDLVGLQEAGVSAEVITAMLARVTADQAPAPAGGGTGLKRAEVLMVADGVEHELLGNAGNYSTTYVVITVLAFMDYMGTEGQVTVTDTTPEFIVATEYNPKSAYYLCRAEVDEDDDKRSIKAGQVGAFGAASVLRPDPDWTLEYEATEVGDGVWKLEPTEELGGGEYALWKAAGETMGTWNAYIYDFAIDAPVKENEGKKKKKKK